MWGKTENSPQQDVAAVREVCRKYDVEFVENRRDWGQYLRENDLPIESLLKDAVHQSDFGASIINKNIIAHLRESDESDEDTLAREYQIEPQRGSDGSIKARFRGNRIDVIGRQARNGGSFRIRLDGKPANEIDAFLMAYVQPNNDNARVGRGSNPRDQSPHGITLGHNVIPQKWTIVMTSDDADYRLTGSITGEDGTGNAFEPFTSSSGQIKIEPELWRRAERNRTGDRFEFTVRRSVLSKLSFRGDQDERVSIRLAQALVNKEHTLELIPDGDGDTAIEYFWAYRPPLVQSR